MSLEWILHPLVPCGLTAAGLGLCLDLFVSLKRDLARAERRRVGDRAALEALIGGWSTAREPRPAGEGEPGRILGNSLNLTVRTQVLGRDRQGETPEQIAAALAVPRHEVALLLKIHRIAAAYRGTPRV